MTHSFPTRRSSDLKCLNTSWLRLTARYFRYPTNHSELLHAPNLASYSTAFLRFHGSACPALVNRDDACPSQSKVVLKSDPGAFHMSRTGSPAQLRSEEHTSELQSLMRISYTVFRFKKKKNDRQPALTQDPGYLIAADLKHTNATRLSVSEMQHHTPLAPDHLR